MKFTITAEDFKNSSGEYDDMSNCPFAIAAKRQIPGAHHVNLCDVLDKDDIVIGHIYPYFWEANFDVLNTSGSTFEAEYTPGQRLKIN